MPERDNNERFDLEDEFLSSPPDVYKRQQLGSVATLVPPNFRTIQDEGVRLT